MTWKITTIDAEHDTAKTYESRQDAHYAAFDLIHAAITAEPPGSMASRIYRYTVSDGQVTDNDWVIARGFENGEIEVT